MTTFIAQPIICKAAVCWAPNQPLNVESIIVAPPKKGEVLVILLYPPQPVILLYCFMRIMTIRLLKTHKPCHHTICHRLGFE